MRVCRSSFRVGLAVGTIFFGQQLLADAGYPPNFAAFCEGDLRPERQADFDASLAAAEQAVRAKNLDGARKALQDAGSAAFRGRNDLDYGKSIKCQGKAKAQRFFDADLGYHLQRQARGDTDIPYWVVAADAGGQGLADFIINRRSGRAGALRRIDDIALQLERDRDYGAFLLPQEERIIAACKDANTRVQQEARRIHDQELAAEDKAFRRSFTEQERAMTSDMASLANALGAAADEELVLTRRRVDDSMNHLREARSWFIYDAAMGMKENESPESARALQRGNAMLAKAGDTSVDALSRDEYFEMAIGYFDFGDWKAEAAQATAARDGIQGEVARRQQQVEADTEEFVEEMRGKAENMEAAMQDMKKTEAEKKSFNEEADALEAELGF